MTTMKLFQHVKDAICINPGEVIFNEGDTGEIMYVIQHGEVDIYINGQHLETVGAGTVIGEMALIDREPRSATAIARTEVRIVAVDRKHFDFLVHHTPGFARQVMGIMADRLRNMNIMA